ncbi:hypothetical protein [Photobacterium sanguinicancri]|uniref:hypothetical protein n=1 Tax=Photobacterium sanguinicancri TaxID=875932 RepID=UPI003D143872
MGIIRVDKLFSIVKEISRNEVGDRKNNNCSKNRKLERLLFLLMVIVPFSLSLIICLIINYVYNDDWLIYLALFFLSITYVSILVNPVITIFVNRKAIVKTAREPFSIICENAESHAKLDLVKYRELLTYSREELDYLLLQLKAERDAFTKRIYLVNGSIDKVGLVPGILALIVLLTKLPGEHVSWIFALAFSSPILHFFGIGMFFLISRLERVIGIVEAALKSKI